MLTSSMHSVGKQTMNCFYWPRFFPRFELVCHGQILAIIPKPLFYNKSHWTWSWSWHVNKNCWQTEWLKLFKMNNLNLYCCFSLELPRREALNIFHPVWNLMAVIWYPFPVSSPAFLPSPHFLSCCHFSNNDPFFPENSEIFRLSVRLFLYALVEQLGL